MCMLFFCFKQKTAYEMRISDWSSDVCSSDLPAVAAFRALGANIVPVGLDEDGIDVEAVEHACRRNAVRAVFVTPHHQFPTTVSLRPERRLRLLDLARQFGFAIIEDDYDHEFHFESQPLLPLAAYGPGHVLYVGSMSKLLLPALRIG